MRKGGGTQLPALVTLLSLAATAAIVSILFWRLHYEAGFTWSEEPTEPARARFRMEGAP